MTWEVTIYRDGSEKQLKYFVNNLLKLGSSANCAICVIKSPLLEKIAAIWYAVPEIIVHDKTMISSFCKVFFVFFKQFLLSFQEYLRRPADVIATLGIAQLRVVDNLIDNFDSVCGFLGHCHEAFGFLVCVGEPFVRMSQQAL